MRRRSPAAALPWLQQRMLGSVPVDEMGAAKWLARLLMHAVQALSLHAARGAAHWPLRRFDLAAYCDCRLTWGSAGGQAPQSAGCRQRPTADTRQHLYSWYSRWQTSRRAGSSVGHPARCTAASPPRCRRRRPSCAAPRPRPSAAAPWRPSGPGWRLQRLRLHLKTTTTSRQTSHAPYATTFSSRRSGRPAATPSAGMATGGARDVRRCACWPSQWG